MTMLAERAPSAADEIADTLYEQVAGRIVGLIDAGTLRVGQRIPSVRKLSGQLKVSVSTVLQAYRLLEDRGRIEARPQSGYYVKASRRGGRRRRRASAGRRRGRAHVERGRADPAHDPVVRRGRPSCRSAGRCPGRTACRPRN